MNHSIFRQRHGENFAIFGDSPFFRAIKSSNPIKKRGRRRGFHVAPGDNPAAGTRLLYALEEIVCAIALCAWAGATFASAPDVSGVTMAQDAVSRVVTISYTLADGPAIVTVDIRTNGVSIAGANLWHFTGDVNRLVESGARTMAWRPDRAWPGHKIGSVVTAWAPDTPPDAEWEFACRAGTGTALYNGQELTGGTASTNTLNALARYRYGGGYLDMGAPNAWGLYDMLGNVWEWCLDWYQESSLGYDPLTGPPSGTSRVSRGGGWYFEASGCRSACRNPGGPSARDKSFGFRLALPLPAAQ